MAVRVVGAVNGALAAGVGGWEGGVGVCGKLGHDAFVYRAQHAHRRPPLLGHAHRETCGEDRRGGEAAQAAESVRGRGQR